MNRREVEQMLVDHNLALVGLTRNYHWKARVKTPDGRVVTVMFPTSESDHRALKNKSAQLRKIAEGVM